MHSQIVAFHSGYEAAATFFPEAQIPTRSEEIPGMAPDFHASHQSNILREEISTSVPVQRGDLPSHKISMEAVNRMIYFTLL